MDPSRRDQTVGSPEIRISVQSQVLPRNMRAYLSNPRNKDNLNNFIFEEWCTNMSGILDEAQTLALSGRFKNHERVVEIIVVKCKKFFSSS